MMTDLPASGAVAPVVFTVVIASAGAAGLGVYV